MSAVAKDINFLPERIVNARKKRKNAFFYSFLSMLFLALACGAVLLPVHIAQGYREKLGSINEDIKKLEPARPHYEEMERLSAELAQKEMALQDIYNNQLKTTDLLKQINSALPIGCYVTILEVKAKEELIIEVVTRNPVETAKVQVGLRSLELFQKVELADVSNVPFMNGPHPVKFSLKFTGASEEKKENKEVPQGNDINSAVSNINNLERETNKVIKEAGKE